MRVGGTYGALRVLGWDKDSIAITGVVPRGTRVDGGFGAGVARGAKFWIEPPAGAPAGDARLELRVPVGARVWVKTGSADVEVRDVRGGLDLNVIGGSVRVTGDPRELAIESMDGNVTIDGAPAWLRVKTATGSIELRGGAGDAALATVSGATCCIRGCPPGAGSSSSTPTAAASSSRSRRGRRCSSRRRRSRARSTTP